ncbi:lytic transglycosylase domain-containing protein [Pseudomonas mosselii]|uniref:Lytic transglycosylase domain-containing protein n=1 Tax=Pseudomonas mosselii TaxID=78327 RepID=A0A7W2JZM3_9PSED|nr:lytic transglycosylase domain-containing protein [Pseudomonas mosselii]MBA6068123.1 lytic transglycosylase domain-containing protein [Pseudomonas mosselii]
MWRTLFFVFIVVVSDSAHAYCFKEAGARYGIDPLLIEAIAVKESRLRKDAINKNVSANGKLLSVDYGVMQVNSINAESLVSQGKIRRADDLLLDACFNVYAGTWVLAKHLRVCGNTWRCLGSYNAGFKKTAAQEQKRLKYASEVRSIYNELKARGMAKDKFVTR